MAETAPTRRDGHLQVTPSAAAWAGSGRRVQLASSRERDGYRWKRVLGDGCVPDGRASANQSGHRRRLLNRMLDLDAGDVRIADRALYRNGTQGKVA